jgi:type I site-specific restriction endonuclease
MTPIDQFFKPEDIIYTYTSKQAVEDGVLFDLDQVSKTTV